MCRASRRCSRRRRAPRSPGGVCRSFALPRAAALRRSYGAGWTARAGRRACRAAGGGDRSAGRLGAVWIGWIEFDVLLGEVHSLKEKRSILRPLIADLSRRTEVAAAEVGAHDLHRRAAIGIS